MDSTSLIEGAKWYNTGTRSNITMKMNRRPLLVKLGLEPLSYMVVLIGTLFDRPFE